MIESLLPGLPIYNPILIFVGGLAIGLLHAFEPDHLSAVSTQLLHKTKSSQESKRLKIKQLTMLSSFRGMIWGMGHTSSIVMIGLLVAGFSLSIPDDFFIGVEFIVGLMLVGLAILTATNKTMMKRQHIHPHTHENGLSHTHPHSHDKNHTHNHKSYLIGCIQGLAGSGGLVALSASTISGFDMMIYFLLLFGVGSIIGMIMASGVMGLPFIVLSRLSHATKYVRYIIAGLTFVIGINIILSIGLDVKLF